MVSITTKAGAFVDAMDDRTALGVYDESSLHWLAPGELLEVPVPARALELDALLRHLEIDGDFADWPNARSHLAQAGALWERLEPLLGVRLERRCHLKDAAQSAREMGAILAKLKDAVCAGASEDVAWLARRAIGLVEAVERAFE